MSSSLAIDPSTPPFVAASADPWTTASFTPPVGSLLVCCASGDFFGGTPTLTISSSGLTFNSEVTVGADSSGKSQIWTCEVAANGGSSRTVSCSTSLSGTSADTGGLKVWVLTGYHASFVNDTGTLGPNDTGNPANPSNILTTTQPGCLCFGIATAWIGSSNVLYNNESYEQFADADLSVISIRKMYEQAVAGDVGMMFGQTTGGAGDWNGCAIAIRPDTYTDPDPGAPGGSNALAAMRTAGPLGGLYG